MSITDTALYAMAITKTALFNRKFYDGDFFIAGIPSPQPRPRAAGKGKSAYYKKSGTFQAWEDALTLGLKIASPPRPQQGALILECTFQFPMTRKQLKTNYEWLPRITTPDTDNLIKTVKDVMEKAGYFHNDSQVFDDHSRKIYHRTHHGVWISLKKSNLPVV